MNKIIIGFICIILPTIIFAQKKSSKQSRSGEKLFNYYCASCHNPVKQATAVPIQKVREVYGTDWVVRFVHNPNSDTSFARHFISGVGSPSYPNLTVKDINAICDYIDSFPYNPSIYEFRKVHIK